MTGSTQEPALLKPGARARRLRSRRAQRIGEGVVKGNLFGAASFSVLITGTIIVVLLRETLRFFGVSLEIAGVTLVPPLREGVEPVSFVEFMTSLEWNPLLGAEKHFGIWPLISGTLLVTAVAMLVALPLGLITAIFMSEYAHPKVRGVLKPVLEILAGIPTVVYGFFALVFLTPALKWFHEGFNVYNAFAAGLAVGVLCLPIVSSLCEDALRAVPRSLRDAAYGLGSTPFDVSLKVVLPAALSGIISAFLLAIARAIGETMVVALAAGSTPRLTVDPREEIQTMTGFMVQMALGDVSNFGVEYLSMYAVAATLFVITFSLTVVGQIIRRRFREAYQ